MFVTKGAGARDTVVERQVRKLLRSIIMAADAVCTTPHVSGEPIYVDFRTTVAKGIVLEDGGAMRQADALLVWGMGCRPCAMAGDLKGPRPDVMMHNVSRGGKVVNMYSNLARISELEQFWRIDWPCFDLDS